MDIYWATVKGTRTEAAPAIVASASGLVTPVAIVGTIVLIITVALVTARLLMADQLTVIERPKTVIVMSDSDAADEESEQDYCNGDS